MPRNLILNIPLIILKYDLLLLIINQKFAHKKTSKVATLKPPTNYSIENTAST